MLPAGAKRLFPEYQEDDLDPRRAAALVIGRLLEDGDGADLRWLAATYAEEELAAWLARRGGRQLSTRSRAFWAVVLGRPAGNAAAAAELWPL